VIEQGRLALFGDHKPADTIVGVETLSRPEYLLEVEATAVVDADAENELG
jgi:enamine deaminase RidA (YjgF/YER057c/UK114 family)